MRDKRRPTEAMWEFVGTKPEDAVRDCGTKRINGGSLVADGEPGISEFAEALADERRRYVLYYLRDKRTAELDDVIERLVAWETGRPPEEIAEQTRTNLRIDLYHAQLPKLEQAGVIEYDRRHGSVRFWDLPDPLETFLDYCASRELPDTNRR